MGSRFTVLWAALPALALAATAPLFAQAPAKAPDPGALVYRQRCASCHALPPAKSPLGPSLIGVVGRKAATGKFAYSPAFKASGLTWDEATLERYLAAPTKVVPGTKMVLGAPDAKQRAAVIAYLKTLL